MGIVNVTNASSIDISLKSLLDTNDEEEAATPNAQEPPLIGQ